MSLNLNIDVNFGGLIEAVKDLIRGNREKLRDKEDNAKIQDKARDSINSKSATNKTTYPSTQPPGFPTGVKTDDKGRIPAQKTGYISASNRYRGGRPGGSKEGRANPGIGNAWVWNAVGTYSITQTGNPDGVYGLVVDGYIYSLDGTNSIQYNMEFQAPVPTGLEEPLPVPQEAELGPDFTFALEEHNYGLNGLYSGSNTGTGFSRKYALPVGPKSMILIHIIDYVYVIVPWKRTVYERYRIGQPYDTVINNDAYVGGIYEYFEAKAFYVGESTVKEIALPESLKDKLVAVTGRPEGEVDYISIYFTVGEYWNGETEITLMVPRSSLNFIPPTNPQTWTYDGKQWLGYLENEDIFADIEVPGGLDPSFKYKTYTAAMYPLLAYGSSWESALLDPEASSVNSKAGTIRPSNTGAFADMTSYERESLYAAAGSLNYEYGSRTVSLGVSPGKLPPPNPYIYAPGNGEMGTANYDLEFYISYDWADPKFCKRRLLALGFSESDLVP